MFLVFLWFLLIALFYEYKKIPHAEEREEVNVQRMTENLGRSIAYHGEDMGTVER